jgi:hypothetical protein
VTGLRVLGALLIFVGATFGVFTTVIAIDQLYVHGSVSHGRAIVWLVGGGVYTLIVGVILLIQGVGEAAAWEVRAIELLQNPL